MIRINLIVLSLLAFATSRAQETIRYYNREWKECAASEASFVSSIKPNGDVWEKVDYYAVTGFAQMQGAYKDSTCKIRHGYFTWYYANKQKEKEGWYKDNKKEGAWLGYHYNGMPDDSVWYQQDIWQGTKMSWHQNGLPKDSIVKMNEGLELHAYWFDNASPSSAGYIINGKKHKTWRFYHYNGNLASEEKYDKGALLEKQYFTEDGQPQSDTTNRDSEAVFGNGTKDWLKYVYKKIYFPSNFNIVNGNKVVAVARYIVNEAGRMEDAYLEIPIHPEFDRIVLNAIKNSPKWKPAISHNRKVKSYFVQPFSFEQVDE
jgi:antitoxin component YwqK of YwqJK toxin-antitoxin module